MGLLVHSAVAGAGLSLGRDVYRKTRDNFIFIVIGAVALAGTTYGIWNMTRGHDRGPVGTLFVTVLMNVVIILVSVALFGVIVMMIASRKEGEHSTTVFMVICAVQATFAAVGLATGLVQRKKRLEAFQVDKDNEAYLEANGFRDVGGNNQTMLDASGNELVLEDFRRDAIVFKVKGRRSVRAKIVLDHTGRMTQYIPV
jgi:hypothetical protein